jgi:tetratricopeptide (TPR) repeat protein
MKNQVSLYILLISVSSLNCWSQQNAISLNTKKPHLSKSAYPIINTQDSNTTITKKIKYYHVEETVSLKFGGYRTIYDVTDPRIINTDDLGPNGKRIITPIYEETNTAAIKSTEIAKNEDSKLQTTKNQKNNDALVKLAIADTTINTDSSINTKSDTKKEQPIQEFIKEQDSPLNYKTQSKITVSDVPKRTETHVYIDLLKTYERMSDKGYVSIDILKKLGNTYFYDNEFDKAEKWYSKLFNLTTDIDPDYYYRYSIVLKSLGNIQKSDEYLKKFNQLSGISSR